MDLLTDSDRGDGKTGRSDSRMCNALPHHRLLKVHTVVCTYTLRSSEYLTNSLPPLRFTQFSHHARCDQVRLPLDTDASRGWGTYETDSLSRTSGRNIHCRYDIRGIKEHFELKIRIGGIGFIGAGTDVSDLEQHLEHARKLLSQPTHPLPTTNSTLPIGVGFINWGAPLIHSIKLIERFRPAAVWFFAPASVEELCQWTEESRKASPETKVWVQIGSVKEALEVIEAAKPDVLIVQGTDAGGHGQTRGAGLTSLVPEVIDAVDLLVAKKGIKAPLMLAAGGIAEKRGAAAALVLGASGVVLGTRFLASAEANIAKGYQDEVLRSSDGGQSTVRTKVYDTLRGTTGWSKSYNGRSIINKSYTDAIAGMDEEENKKLYAMELDKGDAGWGVGGRMTGYASTAVGLINETKPAADIVREVRDGAKKILRLGAAKL